MQRVRKKRLEKINHKRGGQKMEQSLVLKDEFDVNHIQIQVQKIQQIMNSVMKKDEHYGIIPGTQKPTLLKPVKMCL